MNIPSVFEIGWSDLLVIIFIVVILYRFFIKKTEIRLPEVKQLAPMRKRDFTLRQLREFNGNDNERILLAICGRVFDVTRGKDFYGPGGPYGILAGRDATRALATMQLEHVSDDYEDWNQLPQAEKSEAMEWCQRLSLKYPQVGRLIADSDTPLDYNDELASLDPF
ncbi:unnamed protein product [Dracunculus medinensis]|uniref:Cytochrome b5 heme-binding domain-containing protein n=1 Tax=Dracunculus medinensis TaxID=318479 RepID=A0A0N4UGF1_DRAME|nr:unnamed protein product [Dracunculus medinensis]